MDPYHILGISSDANAEEIKRAYRRLVKEFHPDKNQSEEARDRVTLINDAYEILSDPVKRAQYYYQPAYASVGNEEDPIEAYKREFKRKRWEKEQQAHARRLVQQQMAYKIMRIITFPIFFFALTLVIDDFLSFKKFVETPTAGWQERLGRQRKFRGKLISHIQTENFFLRVPNEFHLAYPYYESNKPPVEIFVTPLFNIPRYMHCTLGRYNWRVEVPGTIHSQIFQVPWLLLIASLFIIVRKNFSTLNYALCFLPALLFAYVIVAMA